MRIETAHGLPAPRGADSVPGPAGGDPDARPPSDDLLAALRRAHRRGARIASVCTGAFVLAAAGLLDGRRATTHWYDAPRLAALHPAVEVDPDVLYVDEGDVLTSAGVAAGIDLCLHLVRRDHGADVANAVAKRMIVAPHRDGGQAQVAGPPVPAHPDDVPVGRTKAWALGPLGQRI